MRKEHKKILVVAAHPDDEVLGCGGTMSLHSIKGDEVYVLILGEGITSRDVKRDRKKRNKEIKELRRDIEAANKILGSKRTFLYDFPDNRFDSVPLLDIVKVIEKVKDEIKPCIVYTHHHGDLNIDHRLTFQAVLTACRPLKGESVKEFYSFEVPSSTEWSPDNSKYFMPNYFVDIAETFKLKIEALKKYKTEIREFPHPRSIEAIETIAKSRGIQVGSEAVEAFEAVRIIR